MKIRFLLPFILVACTDSEEDTRNNINAHVNQFYQQAASAKQLEWSKEDISTVAFEKAGDGRLDSLYRGEYQNLRAHYISEADRFRKLAEEEVKQFQLLAGTNQNSALTATKGHLIVMKMESMMDSARFFDQADSLLARSIDARGVADHRDYYHATVSVKGKAGTKQISDTLQFVLDKDLKVIWPSAKHIL